MKLFNLELVTNSKIREGYEIAEKVLLDDELTRRLAIQSEFTYTIDTPFAVAFNLRETVKRISENEHLRIVVGEYWYRNASVIGKTEDNKFFVNLTGTNRKSIRTFIGNGGHEFGHHPMGYGHGSNWQQDSWKGRMMCRMLGEFADKNKSVPNTIARLVVEMAKDKGYL
jgi:hypothetical protein